MNELPGAGIEGCCRTVYDVETLQRVPKSPSTPDEEKSKVLSGALITIDRTVPR
jgi:hypothetical protein